MRLAEYGVPIRTYSGSGNLRLRSGTLVGCSFEAGQLPNGDVLVLSHSSLNVWEDDAADRLTGETSDGWSIEAELDVSIDFLSEHAELPCGTYFAHRAVQMQATRESTAAIHRYGIVNFRFMGTERFTVRDSANRPLRHEWRLRVDLADVRGSIPVLVEPVAGYRNIASELSALRGITVTCEAVIDAAQLRRGVNPDVVIGDLCLVLSVARGTRVEWLYRRDLDAAGAEVSVAHFSHITRRFQPLAPLDHRAGAREHTKRFVEGAYAALPSAEKTYELRRGLIAAYVDSRTEDDFLEMRGVKVSVLAEMIKAQHGRHAVGSRPRFRAALGSCCREVGFAPTEEDLKDFVSTRNRLLHEGRFRSDPTAPLPCRFANQTAEYFFMLSFIDRFFLKLFGYSGPFLDWSQYPNSERGMLN
jgi:hypothetical protein